jgi:hypothetical protein
MKDTSELTVAQATNIYCYLDNSRLCTATKCMAWRWNYDISLSTGKKTYILNTDKQPLGHCGKIA